MSEPVDCRTGALVWRSSDLAFSEPVLSDRRSLPLRSSDRAVLAINGFLTDMKCADLYRLLATCRAASAKALPD
jgi:hypothetical protein